MADYYPLIARAVAGLDKNTGEARRALYERARAALVAQLRGVTPVLDESDVTRERLALEEAIRKVEGESARQTTRSGDAATRVKAPEFPRWSDRETTPEPEAEPPPKQPARRPQPPPSQEGRAEARAPAQASGRTKPERRLPDISYDSAAPSDAARPERADPARRAQATARPPDGRARATAGPARQKGEPRYADLAYDPAEEEVEAREPQRPAARSRPSAERGDRRSLLDSGLRGFREVVSEAGDLGEASARANRSARENLGAAPSAADARGRPHDSDEAYLTLDDIAEPVMLEPSFIVDESRPVPPRGRQSAAPAAEVERAPRTQRTPRNYGDMIRIAIAALIVVGIGGLLIWQWPNMVSIYSMLTAPSKPAEDAVDQPTPTPPPQQQTHKDPGRFDPGSKPPDVAAEVAQKVVLYEEDPSDPNGKRSVGSAVWRTEAVSPGTGKPPELAVRADVEIPERNISITWTLRRDAESNGSTSHTIEIMFKLPPNFPSGGIFNVPGIWMKQAEETQGTALAGLAVKVTTNYFLIGLSNAPADRDRNIQLLKERPWFDIPIVYTNNRRAILAMEKGTPGERAFQQAFAAWTSK